MVTRYKQQGSTTWICSKMEYRNIAIMLLTVLHGVFALDIVPICSDTVHSLKNTEGASFYYNGSIIGFTSCTCTLCDVQKRSEEEIDLIPKQIIFNKSDQKFELYRPHGNQFFPANWQNNSGEKIRFSLQNYCMNMSLTLKSGPAYVTVEANFSDVRHEMSVTCLTEGKQTISDISGGDPETQTGNNQSSETVTIAVSCTIAGILLVVVCVVIVLLVRKAREMHHLRASMFSRSNEAGNKSNGQGSGFQEYNPYITSRISYSNHAYEDVADIIPSESNNSQSAQYQYQETPTPPDPSLKPKYNPDQSAGSPHTLALYDNNHTPTQPTPDDTIHRMQENNEININGNSESAQTNIHSDIDEPLDPGTSGTPGKPSDHKELIENGPISREQQYREPDIPIENGYYASLEQITEPVRQSPLPADGNDAQESTTPNETDDNVVNFYNALDRARSLSPQRDETGSLSEEEEEEGEDERITSGPNPVFEINQLHETNELDECNELSEPQKTNEFEPHPVTEERENNETAENDHS